MNVNKLEYDFVGVNIKVDQFHKFRDWVKAHPIYSHYKRYEVIAAALEQFMEAGKKEAKK